MAKNWVYVGIATLAIIAGVLGYKIYQQQVILKNQPAINQQSNNNSLVSKQATPQPAKKQEEAPKASQSS